MNLSGIEHTYLFEHGGFAAVILGGLFIFIVTILASILLVHIMYRGLKKATGGDIGGTIIANIIRACIWLCGFSIILKVCFNIDTTVIIGALGVGGIALSLGMQTTISNLIGGLLTAFSRDVNIGDWITLNSITGKIIDVTWRSLKIQDSYGNFYIIPNSMITSTAVSVLTPYQPIKVPLVFSRKADLDTILKTLPDMAKEELSKAGYLHEEKVPMVAINGTAVDSIQATLIMYATYDASDTKILDSVMPGIIEYLRSIDALAICGEQ